MLEALKIIYEANKVGIWLWVSEEKVRFRSYSEHDRAPEIMAKLREHKDEILKVLEYNKIHDDQPTQPFIYRISENEERSVASFPQERLWFIEEYEQGTDVYHMPGLVELEKDDSIPALQYALRKIVERHEVLRSTIEQQENRQCVQVIHNRPLAIEEVTLTEADNYELLIDKEVSRPFDLKKEYPIRVKFYRIGSGSNSRTILLVNIHHIASDGWSTEIFQRELFSYYQAYVRKDLSFSLPALEIQYKDYALWQRSFLSGETVDKQLKYWKERLNGYQALNLPTDYARPNRIDYRGSHQEFVINRQVSARLRNLSKQLGVTVHSALLSGISILLSKYSGQEDIVVGSPIANRHHRQTQDLIGFFVNMQINRTLLSRSQSYEDLIVEVHQQQVSAQLHQDLPFEKLVNELGVDRDLSRHPIFQVAFVTQSFGGDARIGEEQSRYLKPFKGKLSYEVEKFDLSVFMDDSGEEMSGHVSYATSLFSRSTISNLIKHYTFLLEELTNEPKKIYSQLSLLDQEEYGKIVYEWNNTDKVYRKDKTIHQVFEEQVERTPANIALVFEDRRLSYRELNDKSNQLARHIREQYEHRTGQSMKSDTLVALCMERSLEMVIGILAVLKAGGAYVPIDPSYPQERIDFMLQDTGAVLVISQRKLNGEVRLPEEKIVYANVSERLYNEYDNSNLPGYSTSIDLCYVIYTSGTTGKPKGVMIEHHQVLSFVIDNNFIDYEKVGTVAGISNYAFDGSVFDIFFSLMNGKKLVIVSRTSILDMSLLADQFARHNVDTALIPTALFNSLVLSKSRCLDVLKQILSGGEACSLAVVNHFKRNYTSKSLINLYGPTENIVCASYCNLTNYNTERVAPIGVHLSDKKTYILDGNLVPVPIGVVGELYLGGAGVARGYLNNKELTQQRFVANVFASESDRSKGYTRLYKTGDLVRWLEDGNIEYIGRNDEQVKIRGYRIEPAEVEHAMNQVGGIRQSCVVVKERDTQGGVSKYLVGYYVKDADVPVSESMILEILSRSLPEYMVPAVLVGLDSFPVTGNGKLDRSSLPDADFTGGHDQTSARTGPQAMLCRLWEEVLGLDQVGIHDDFFRIGGDSILSIQLSSRLRKAGYRCQVRDIFECKTIARLLLQIGENSSDDVSVKAEQGLLRGLFGLLPVQQWFVGRVMSGEFQAAHHWNQSFLVKVGKLDIVKLGEAVERLYSHHDILRVRYHRAGGGWRQEYQESLSSVSPLKTLDVKGMGDERIHQVLTDWQSGFDLDGGRLFQAGYLYGYDDGSSRLYFALHHMIVDSVSWRILVEDVRRFYEGDPPGLKSLSYRQWVEFIEGYPASHRQEGLYWKSQLEGVRRYEEFKFKEESFCRVSLSKDQTGRLLHEASKAYHTQINDLLLTAVAYSLGDLNGDEVQGITLEGHGREDLGFGVDPSHTVGWFTSLFPVKLRVGGSLGESIQQIKETLGSIPSRGVGFGSFATQGGFDYSLSDLVGVSFNYLGQFGMEEGVSGGSGGVGWQIVPWEGSGVGMSSSNPDHNVIQITGLVSEGELAFGVTTRLGGDITDRLGRSLERHLVELIDHCVEKYEQEGVSYTPSDFYEVRHEGDLSNLPLVRNVSRCYDPFPMTDIQKAYLLGRLDTFEIGGVTNHIYQEFTYRSGLDVERLERVLHTVVSNYLELRTVFDISTLTQRYLDISQIGLYRISVEDHGCPYRADLLKATRDRLSHYVYDAGQYPLFTFCISRFKDVDVLHVSLDLILLDVESRQNFFRELTMLYGSDEYKLKEPGLNFKDYQDYVSFLKYSHWYASDKKYWDDKLKDIPLRPDLVLKADPRTISRPKFAMSGRVVGEARWMKFKEKTVRYGVSASSALLCLYGYVLSRYSGRKDFLITLTVFNRYSIHPDVNKTWGDFTSTNLFSYRHVKGSIRDRLEGSHQELWNDLSHGLFSGLDVQRQVQSIHGLDPYQAVSPIVFTGRLSGNQRPALESEVGSYFLDESEVLSSRFFQGQTSQAWIDLQAMETGTQFSSIWLYVEQLFDKEFIDRLNEDYCYLIEYLAEREWDNFLPALPLPAADRMVIDKANEYVQQKVSSTLVDISLSSVRVYGDSIAVIDRQGSYSYRQIGGYVEGVGGYVHHHGLSKRNQLIGVLSEKGYQQVVATLGIMLAGSAYLPLHVDWPEGRVDEILQEGSVDTVLVSQGQFRDRIEGSALENKYKWIVIESIVSSGYGTESLLLPKADDIAYVIFTSGSTGKPKGVTISHRGCVNTIEAVNRVLEIGSQDKILALSELSFDLSVYDLFGTLAAGGTIVFPDQQKSREPSHWYDLMERHGITVWDTVPQLMQLLVDHVIDQGSGLGKLRLVLMSGDWIPVRLPDQIRALNEGIKVVSLGGATEGSIWSIWYAIERVDPSWKSIPYGQAMPNQKMYVLDEDGNHCPLGVMGDIYIGGEGVALGYWNDEVKTRLSFITHDTLGKIYKTGDLGRWNSGGYIEFEGRKDNQVKLNGYRVELDEISSRLTRIEGVDKALTTIQDNQLVAYLVLQNTGADPNQEKVDSELFKLQQIGISKNSPCTYKITGLDLDEQKYRLRKSYRRFREWPSESTHQEIINLLTPGPLASQAQTGIAANRNSDLEILNALLSPLSAITLPDKALPKYLYPSPGSTNAIQTFVSICKDIDKGELKKGYYYYEPVSHHLSIVEENSTNDPSEIKLTFKLFKPAIEPIYGNEAINLAWLELGHIVALLDQQLAFLGLSSRVVLIDREENDHRYLADFVVSSLAADKVIACEVAYLQRHETGFSDKNHQYSPFVENIAFKTSEISQLLENCHGLLVFNGAHTPEDLIRSGYQAQLLTEKLYRYDIGSCALGIAPYAGANYCMAIGKISMEDKLLSEVQLKRISVEDYINKEIEKYLPAYMIPRHYITLSELPLTANGKVDHKRLPKAEVARDRFVAPTNDAERIACDIWCELLHVEKVGTTDDFFGIGGNSILATRAASKMSRELECNIRVADIFKSRTIKAILANIPMTKFTDGDAEWVFPL